MSVKGDSMGIKKNFGKSTFDRYIFGMLVALELLMSFTFLGYISIPPISVTIAYIPVILAGYMLGTFPATVIGALFGFTSLYKASAYYVMPMDRLFSPFFSTAPLSSFILSVGTRTLFGFLVGLLFSLAKKTAHPKAWCIVVAGIAYKIHAFLVYTAMGIFFPFTGYSYLTTLNIRWHDFVFIPIDILAVVILWRICYGDNTKQLREYIDNSHLKYKKGQKTPRVFYILEVLSVIISFVAMLHFSNRAFYMISQYKINASTELKWDIIHLQGEFLIAFLSINILSMLVLLLTYKYMAYREYKGEMDGLTGVMGRKMFLRYSEGILRGDTENTGKYGWFIFLDVDRFKDINDTFGHPAGDKVLKEVGQTLMRMFSEYGAAGRMGGDEFAVIIDKPMAKKGLAKLLDNFLDEISGILDERKISCSIGVRSFVSPKNMSKLLAETDNVLYKAKRNGRACYVIEDDISRLSDICE